MASSSLSAIPILPHIALDKLITYLSRDHPSSSPEASKAKLQQLEDANQKLTTMQSQAKNLLQKYKQDVTVINLLKKLNDIGYEIQDLESYMEYKELQGKVEKIEQAEADTSQSSEKRRRLSSSEPLKPDDIMISRLIKQINWLDSDMNVLLNRIPLNEKNYDLSGKNHLIQNKRVTTSSTNERKIYGRKNETKKLIKLLLEEPNYFNGNISVVPILGMGGIGKTILAQFAFNNPEIEDYFDKRVWVFVSDHFDRFRITKEIAESLSTDDVSSKFPYDTTNLDILESKIKSCLRGKKFLLVLDDVWSDEWQQLLAPFRLAEVKSIKIIVAGRDPKVVTGLETRDRFLLGGLSGDDYKSFFIDCVFGNENPPDNYSLALQCIGEEIMEKLEGYPLAVKTMGRLLKHNLTEEHWNHVLDSDLWEIGSDDANDIMPTLALSYHHLPEHLQLCFAFCSMFPKGCMIHKYELIHMWITHGYILESGTNSKTLEDIGEEYVEELNQLSLIEVNEYDGLCKMRDLLHDLAELVSHGEVCYYEGKKGKRVSRNVRHLCVCGPVDPGSVQLSNSLRTLVLYGDDICSQVDLKALRRIRVLVVIDENMEQFPEAVTHLKHLRYLDFCRSSFKTVPESLCRLYLLRVLRLPKLDALPSLFHSLINLRNFLFFPADHSNYRDLHLWENLYQVRREGGYKIAQLMNMNELRGMLEIRGLENIENREEARKANLKEKGLIKYLRLCWEDSVGAGCIDGVQEEVFEGLQPHHNLKHLEIHGYMGSKSPSWLWTKPAPRWLCTTPAALQMLTRIGLVGCRNWSRLPPSIGLLPFLEFLSLGEMENITIEGDDTVTMIFPSLKKLKLYELASVSFERMPLSSSQPEGGKLFPLLEKLRFWRCDVVNGLPWPMLSQLSKLDISDSRGLDAQLPGCLNGLKSLTRLEITSSKCETLFDREVMATLERLNHVTIKMCNELISVDGLQVLPSLTSLSISLCSTLRWWWVEEGTSEQQQGVLLPKLSDLSIRYCENLESLPACLLLLSSLETLRICFCRKLRWWCVEEGTSEQQHGVLLPNLSGIYIEYCDLESLPACLLLLPSLTSLSISHCWRLRRLWVEGGTSEQHGVLLPKLYKLSISYCEDLESLPACLPLLPLLECLEIEECPKVRSLPEGGLPSSLRKLVINPGLMECCQQELFNPESQMIRSYTRLPGEPLYIWERNEETDLSETDEEADFDNFFQMEE